MKKIKRVMKKKGQLNISFGWLFAIIVGITILILTIYGVTKLIKGGGDIQQAVGAKDFGIALNVLETGFESASSVPFTRSLDTRIYNRCNPSGNFGKQGIRLSEFSFNEWSPSGLEVSFENKYIFSDKIVEGKQFYLFSKPFEFPFKVADLIYLTSSEEKYCFDFNGAPFEMEDIEEEITQMGQANLAPNCTKPNQIKICFGRGSDCNITVKSNYVEKNGDELSFKGDALMYAAIFSDKRNYDCQVERLLKRTKSLALLYGEKARLMSQRGCDTNLESDLTWLSNIPEKSDISKITVEDIGDKNYYAECKLW